MNQSHGKKKKLYLKKKIYFELKLAHVCINIFSRFFFFLLYQSFHAKGREVHSCVSHKYDLA